MKQVGPIVFYDGLCGLCNGSVRFILPRDKAAHYRFAALQSSYAIQTLGRQALPDSIVLLTSDGKLLLKSEAIIAIASKLSMPWRLFGLAFRCVPLQMRDTLYDFVARHRSRFFGRYEVCPLPRPEWKGRFVGDLV